jgi:hypothetical protein
MLHAHESRNQRNSRLLGPIIAASSSAPVLPPAAVAVARRRSGVHAGASLPPSAASVRHRRAMVALLPSLLLLSASVAPPHNANLKYFSVYGGGTASPAQLQGWVNFLSTDSNVSALARFHRQVRHR